MSDSDISEKLVEFFQQHQISDEDITAVRPSLSPVKTKKTDEELAAEVNRALEKLGLDVRG
eukprot:1760702-Rhodomonas_salina.1